MIPHLVRTAFAAALLVCAAVGQGEIELEPAAESSPAQRAFFDALLRQYTEARTDRFLYELVEQGVAAGGEFTPTGGFRSPAPFDTPGMNQGGTYDSYVMESTLLTPEPFPLERYLIALPVPRPPDPMPLLLLFHSSAHTCRFPLKCEELVEAATKRGWYVVCATGGVKQHYASIEGQIKHEIVFDYVLSQLNPAGMAPRIDTQRIYGVGFSMGGGAVMNYAARHLDPREPMIAAMINLSGGVAHKHTFEVHPPSGPALLFWFEDPDNRGELAPYLAQRSSLISFDTQTCVVDTTEDVVRNVQHIPTHIRRYEMETGVEFVEKQSDVLFNHMSVTLGHPDVSYTVVPGPGHDWKVIDPEDALNFLEPFVLDIPTSGNTIADRDARYFYFDVFQDVPDVFSPFSWRVETASNEVALFNTANLERAELDLAGAPLDPAQTLTVLLGPSPNLGVSDTLILNNYPNPPSSVLRDAVADFSWKFDDLVNVLVLTEASTFGHVWEIEPGPPAIVDPIQSTAIAVPSSNVVANGVDVSTITATIRDAAGNPLAGQRVRLAVNGLNNTITQPAEPTDPFGVASGTISSTLSGVKTITVIVNPTTSAIVLSEQPAIEFIGDANTIDPILSTATASPNAAVVADGSEVSAVTVVVLDANSNPVVGQEVEIAVSGSNNTVTQPGGPTDANGTATATLASTRAELKTITVTVNPNGAMPIVLAQTPTVEFIGDANNISGTLSTATADPAVDVVANGSATSTITVTVLDVNGNAVPGQAVELASDGSNNTITQPSGSTDPAGMASGTIASITAELKTITVTVNPAGTPIELTQKPTIGFIGDATMISGSLSSATANPATGVVADGSTTSEITITVRDINNNPVPSEAVKIEVDGTDNSVNQPADTDANGVTVATVASTKAELKTVTVTARPGFGETILDDVPTVEFIADANNISTSLSTASANPATGVIADGSETSTISVTVVDANGNPVEGQTVELASDGSNNTITQPAATTDANGVATGTIASTTSELKTITATVNPGGSQVVLAQTPTVEFIADANNISASLSTASANPATGVVADGVEISTITVTVVDANGNPVAGQTVELASTGSNNTITQPAATTDANGVATGTIASTTSELKTITATVNPGGSQVVLTQTPTVEFIADASNISGTLSTASANPATGVVADGVEISTITVTVVDANGNPVAGQIVELASTGSNNTITQPAGPTDANGVAAGTIASTTAEVKTLTATVNPGASQVVLTQMPTVEFIADPSDISATLSTASANPATGVVADGIETSTITVTVVDANGNPVAGQTVQLASDGSNNTVTQPSGTTDANGVATGTIASTTAELKTITATVNPGGSQVVLTQTPTVEFVP